MPSDRADDCLLPRGRTLFLSDLHLGALSSQAGLALHFLIRNPAQTYVLVGDFLDLWHPMLPNWTPEDQAVIDHLRARVRMGSTIIYVRGNHDPDPAAIPEHARLPATHVTRHVHEALNGKRYLVIHGDEADSRLIRLHLMTRLGSVIDHALRRVERLLRRQRDETYTRGAVDMAICGLNVLRYRGRSHERRMVQMARDEGLDGVICGHFHIAALHDHFGLTYANCGDWIDSMTALDDSGDGVLRRLGGRKALIAQTQGLQGADSKEVTT
jgi:UDP-2,3-diacylglucosamine pyrophosphatase LpxH